MVTFFKSSHVHTATLSAPNPAEGHRGPTMPPETPGHSQASLGLSLVGSLLLSLGSCCTQGFACTLQESVSPVCVGSGGSMVGLMATSSNTPYGTPRSATPRAPAPAAGHCRPIPPQETCKQSKAVPSQPLWDLLVYTRFCLSPLSVSAG